MATLSGRMAEAIRSSRSGVVEGAAAAVRRSPVRRAVMWQRHRGLEPTDAFLASFPRSGNTWLRFILAELATGDDADFVSVDRTLPNVGAHAEATRLLPGGGRLIKTHEPWRPAYRRAVYVVRDPRDVLVSWYSLLRGTPGPSADLDTFVEDFVRGRTSGYGTWQAHVQGWHDAAERSRGIHFARFEDLRADTPTFVAGICDFLRISADRERVAAVVAHNSKTRMRELEQKDEGYLRRYGRRHGGVREGRVGGWREILDDRHLRQMRPLLDAAATLGYET